MTRRPDLLVRVLLFAGWSLGLVSLLDPEQMPFFVLTILGGLLLIAAGVALGSDGGRAMASMADRYAPWQRVPPFRVMAALLIVIGAIWTVFGISSALS